MSVRCPRFPPLFPSTVVALSSLLILIACSGGGGGTCVVVSIQTTPSSPSTSINSAVQFGAVARDAGGRTCGSVTFTWSSSNSFFAPIDPVSGLATTPYSGSPGDYPQDIIITATDSGSGLMGQTMLTVNFSLFGSPTEFSLGGAANPQAIVIGQFSATNDTDLDVAVADEDTGDVSVLLGDGAGGLGAASALSTSGSDPVALATGSFNPLDDGFTDIAAVNSLSDDVSIQLGDGAGSFTAASPATVATDQAPQSVAVGDFDEDGQADLATANFIGNGTDGDVTIVISNGDGTFTEDPSSPLPLAGSGPWAIATGYIDGDTHLDLVVSDLTGDAVWVFLGNGDGTFQTPTPWIFPLPFGTGPAAIVIDDFDNDTFTDLAVVNQGTADTTCPPSGNQDSITVLLGTGDGNFNAPVTYPVGSNPRAIAAGDFNNDGAQDLVIANFCDDSVTVLPGVGDGTFPISSTFSTGSPENRPTGVAVGDLDNDGFDDIAVSNAGTDSVSVLLNND